MHMRTDVTGMKIRSGAPKDINIISAASTHGLTVAHPRNFDMPRRRDIYTSI